MKQTGSLWFSALLIPITKLKKSSRIGKKSILTSILLKSYENSANCHSTQGKQVWQRYEALNRRLPNSKKMLRNWRNNSTFNAETAYIGESSTKTGRKRIAAWSLKSIYCMKRSGKKAFFTKKKSKDWRKHHFLKPMSQALTHLWMGNTRSTLVRSGRPSL